MFFWNGKSPGITFRKRFGFDQSPNRTVCFGTSTDERFHLLLEVGGIPTCSNKIKSNDT